MELFTQIIYQPFLNILVGFYWMLGKTTVGYDMGVAVILLTILIRIILLPMTLLGHRSEKERREIEEKIKDLKKRYGTDPVRLPIEMKKLLKSRPRILISEGFMITVQVIISLILWRIFATGLKGEDLHLLYSWMPEVSQPFNLVFLNTYDLTHPNMVLNLVQTLVIFLLEAVVLITSPYPTNRSEVIRVQFTLPVVSFLVFAFLPSGKKLFIITTLIISIIIALVRHAVYLYHKHFPEPEPETAQEQQYVIVPESVMNQMKAKNTEVTSQE